MKMEHNRSFLTLVFCGWTAACPMPGPPSVTLQEDGGIPLSSSTAVVSIEEHLSSTSSATSLAMVSSSLASSGSFVPASSSATPVNTLTLDPSSLLFVDLPTDSVGFAVVGRDAVNQACVTLGWTAVDPVAGTSALCDWRQGASTVGFFVTVRMPADGPCTGFDWPTAATTVVEMHGCLDVAHGMGGGANLADAETVVTGTPFTGRIVVHNRNILTPAPVTFTLGYTTDVPENAFVQTSWGDGLPRWIEVENAQGTTQRLFDDCGMVGCDNPTGPTCGPAQLHAYNFLRNSYSGYISLTWDGFFHPVSPSGTCRLTTPAPRGAYTAHFCMGYAVVDEVVTQPTCQDVSFTLPSETGRVTANFGGGA